MLHKLLIAGGIIFVVLLFLLVAFIKCCESIGHDS